MQINQRIGEKPGLQFKDVMMRRKFPAVGLALLLAGGALVATGIAKANAEQLKYDKRGRVTYGSSGPNVVIQQGPHTRLYVSKRSWLDAGTEVRPGERKFTDYAFPPGYSYGQQIDRLYTSRRPLGDQWDTGTPFPFPLY